MRRLKVTLKRLIYEEHIINTELHTDQKPELLEHTKHHLPDNILMTDLAEVTEIDVIEENLDA